MAAHYTKVDPNCGPVGQIVFVGNIGLQAFAEGPDPRYSQHPADAEMAIDVMAPDGFEMVAFQDITLTLAILEPPEAVFTDHSHRNNYNWTVPNGADGWVSDVRASPVIRAGGGTRAT